MTGLQLRAKELTRENNLAIGMGNRLLGVPSESGAVA